MRINIVGSLVDRHRDKKAETRGLSWHPSGPFAPGDTLKAGRADTPTPRQLTATRRSLPCALFLTPALVVATVARGRAASRAASRRGPSVQQPWRASVAASASPSPCRASAPAGAEGGVRWREVNKNYRTRDTRPAAAGYRPRPCRAWRPDVPPPPHADGWSG